MLIKSRPNYTNENWLIIVHPDHGGIGTSHGGQTGEERRIFIVVSGQRCVVEPPSGIVSIPPTVLEFLGVPISPGWGWEEGSFGLTGSGHAACAVVSGDVGITTLPGGGNYTNGIFTLKGGGYGIWGNSDEFHRGIKLFRETVKSKGACRLGAEHGRRACQGGAWPIRREHWTAGRSTL